MTGRVVFTDPDTGALIDGFDLDSLKDGELLDARDLVSRMLGIVGDSTALLAKIEGDADFRRALAAAVYEPIFQGLHGGRLDEIVADRIAAAQSMCRAVEARIACEAALKGCAP